MRFRDRISHVRRVLERRADQIILNRVRARPHNHTRQGHVLVAGPGGGSVGDEAMYQAFVHTKGPGVVVIVRDRSELMVDANHFGASLIEMPDLLYGSGLGRLRDLRRFVDIASNAESVSIIGADTMDGVYNLKSSLRRFRLAVLAEAAGATTTVLGFSWNSNPPREVVRELQQADASVQLCIRDARSLSRVQADGGHNAIQVADLAFLTPADDPILDPDVSSWCDRQDSEARKIVVVNANPRLEGTFPGQFEAYVALAKGLIGAGHSVLLIAHDSRGGDRSEVAYLERLHARIGEAPHIARVPWVVAPPQVIAVTRRAVLVVTGRMHLMILAAVAGTPSVGLEYQDKFRGLCEMLGAGTVVTSTTLGQDALLERVNLAMRAAGGWHDELGRSRDRVAALSRLNFSQH